MIQYLLYPDDNTQCQPFYQLFHHEIQDRNFVETDSCFSKKMEEYTLPYSLHQYCLQGDITHASIGAREVHDYFHMEFLCIWKPLPTSQ